MKKQAKLALIATGVALSSALAFTLALYLKKKNK